MPGQRVYIYTVLWRTGSTYQYGGACLTLFPLWACMSTLFNRSASAKADGLGMYDPAASAWARHTLPARHIFDAWNSQFAYNRGRGAAALLAPHLPHATSPGSLPRRGVLCHGYKEWSAYVKIWTSTMMTSGIQCLAENDILIDVPKMKTLPLRP